MEQFNDDLMIMIIRRVLEDKPLSDFDVNRFGQVFFPVGLDMNLTEREMKTRIKKFNQAIPNFLTKVSE